MPQRLAGYVFMNICLSKGGRRSGFDLSKFLVGTTVDTGRSVRDLTFATARFLLLLAASVGCPRLGRFRSRRR